ncbi:ABC transporter ATP-binding protein [Microbacterium sp.]|uniref:ABC transporter ATP-binding protein n=1 Tax=Microbacterium sp. TaxID=51671 RepID=UPI0039E3E421
MALRAVGLGKRFGELIANADVDFELRRGEVHALVGENGAGKSTLMKMLYGMYRPDQGHLEIDGTRIEFHRVADAIDAGIGMVHQHFMLVPEFSVERNVLLGREPRRLGFIDRAASARALTAPMAALGLDLDARRQVGELSVADQQRVEILKVIARDARVMILDEPTAVLTPQETAELFRTLRTLAATGVSVIFITHKLWEVKAAADRVTVLRKGRTRGTFDVDAVGVDELVERMTGRSDVVLGRIERTAPTSRLRLEVEGLSGRQAPDTAVRNLDFAVREGEILGIAGVDGNGQNSLAALLAGGAQPQAGSIRLDGREISRETIAQRRCAGVAVVPEDRHREGLPLHASVLEGLAPLRLARRRGAAAPFGPALTRRLRAWAFGVVQAFGVVTASLQSPASTLSGGNQQKVVVARELDAEPALLVLSQPTRGVDLGSAEGIYGALSRHIATGAAAVMVSADLDELLRICDRILVLYRGEIALVADAAGTSREELGRAMAGAHLTEGR